MIDLYEQEGDDRRELITLLSATRRAEQEWKEIMRRADAEFREARLMYGRMNRKRLGLEKELQRLKGSARRKDYRIRRRNLERLGDTLEFLRETPVPIGGGSSVPVVPLERRRSR